MQSLRRVGLVLLAVAVLLSAVSEAAERKKHVHSGHHRRRHAAALSSSSISSSSFNGTAAPLESAANAEFLSRLVKDKSELAYSNSLEEIASAPDATQDMKDLWSSYKGMKNHYFPRMQTYIADNRGFWAKKLKAGGTLSNFETGLVWLLTLGKGTEMKTGCLQMQGKTMELLNEYQTIWQRQNNNRRFPWRMFNLQVGRVMEHHAVGVFPVGRAPEDGFVADAWIKQESKFWTWKEWNDHYEYTLTLIGKAKHEDGDPCFTHAGKKYIDAPGQCERTMTWGFCSVNAECKSVRGAGKTCAGKCLCGTTMGFGNCKCVKEASPDQICVDISAL